MELIFIDSENFKVDLNKIPVDGGKVDSGKKESRQEEMETSE